MKGKKVWSDAEEFFLIRKIYYDYGIYHFHLKSKSIAPKYKSERKQSGYFKFLATLIDGKTQKQIKSKLQKIMVKIENNLSNNALTEEHLLRKYFKNNLINAKVSFDQSNLKNKLEKKYKFIYYNCYDKFNVNTADSLKQNCKSIWNNTIIENDTTKLSIEQDKQTSPSKINTFINEFQINTQNSNFKTKVWEIERIIEQLNINLSSLKFKFVELRPMTIESNKMKKLESEVLSYIYRFEQILNLFKKHLAYSAKNLEVEEMNIDFNF